MDLHCTVHVECLYRRQSAVLWKDKLLIIRCSLGKVDNCFISSAVPYKTNCLIIVYQCYHPMYHLSMLSSCVSSVQCYHPVCRLFNVIILSVVCSMLSSMVSPVQCYHHVCRLFNVIILWSCVLSVQCYHPKCFLFNVFILCVIYQCYHPVCSLFNVIILSVFCSMLSSKVFPVQCYPPVCRLSMLSSCVSSV